MKKFLFILTFGLIFGCDHKDKTFRLEISPSLFLYQKPQYEDLQQSNFPIDLIYPSSKINYFVHLERTGIWTPDQYALLLEIPHSQIEKVLTFYKNILKIKEWQILQSKQIHVKEKDLMIYFINAQDYLNRNLSLLIEESKKKVQVKIYIKKLTDE